MHGSGGLLKTLFLHLREVRLLFGFLLLLHILLVLSVELVALRAEKWLVIQPSGVGDLDEVTHLGTLKLDLTVEVPNHMVLV